MNNDHIKIESDAINLIVEKIIKQIDKYINNENKFFHDINIIFNILIDADHFFQ